MRGHEATEPIGALDEAHAVERSDAGRKGRMMHDDAQRVRAGLRQAFLDPAEAPGAEASLDTPVHQGVEGEDPQAVESDLVVEEFGIGEGDRTGERLAQGGTLVVIAGDDEDGNRERREQVAQQGVIRGRSAIGQIAREHHGVERRTKRRQVGDNLGCRLRGIGTNQRGLGAFSEDVEVGYMSDQH